MATNSTSVTDKDVLLLTATIVSANGNSLMCHFYENGTQIGPVVAINNLQAQMTTGPLSSGNTYVFTAGP